METTHRALNSAEAERLGDLFGIIRDLDSVVEFCTRLVAAYGRSPLDFHLLDALSTACVIRYCRCFEMGVRAKLARECVVTLAPRFADFHDYLFALRQKHLAHPVNDFEMNQAAVELTGEFSCPSVVDIKVLGGRVAGLDRPTADNLKVLADTLRRAAVKDYDLEKARLLEHAKSLSPDEVVKLPEVPPFAPDWTRAKETRPRHRGSR